MSISFTLRRICALGFFFITFLSNSIHADIYTRTYQEVMRTYGVKAIPHSTIVSISDDVARVYGLPGNLRFVVKWWEYKLIDKDVVMTKPVHAYFHGWHSTPACFSPEKIRLRLLSGRPQINFAQIGHGLGVEALGTTDGFRSYAMIDGKKIEPEDYNLRIMNAGLVAFYRHAERLYGPMTTEGHSNGGMQTHAANARQKIPGTNRWTSGFIKPLKMIIDGRPPDFMSQNKRMTEFIEGAEAVKRLSDSFNKHVINYIPEPVTRFLLRSYLDTVASAFGWVADFGDLKKKNYRYVGGTVPDKPVRYNWLTKKLFVQFALMNPLALAGSVTPVGIDMDFFDHILGKKDYEWSTQRLTSDALIMAASEDPIGAEKIMENALEIGADVNIVRAIILGAGHVSELYDEYVSARLKIEDAFLDGTLDPKWIRTRSPIYIHANPPGLVKKVVATPWKITCRLLLGGGLVGAIPNK